MLNKDIDKMTKYFTDWRLKPNTAKTVPCIFHLNNRQASRKLNLKLNGKTVEYDKTPNSHLPRCDFGQKSYVPLPCRENQN